MKPQPETTTPIITTPNANNILLYSPSPMKKRSKLIPSFDILSELSNSDSPYNRRSPDSLIQQTIYALPSDIRLAIDIIRHQSDLASGPPSISRILYISLSHGIGELSSHPYVLSAKSTYSDFCRLQNVDSRYYKEAYLLISQRFHVSPVLSSLSTQKRQNINISQEVQEAVTSLTSTIGLSFSSISIISILITLSTQWPISQKDREEMESAVQSFYARVKLRTQIMRLVIDELSKTSSGEVDDGGQEEY